MNRGSDRLLSTYEEAVDALCELEGRAVALDTIVNRVARDRPAHLPTLAAGLQPRYQVGILKEQEFSRSGDSGVDEAAWWHRMRGKTVIGIEPDGGFLVDKARFRDAWWEGNSLSIDHVAGRAADAA